MLPGCMIFNGVTGRLFINPDLNLCRGSYRIKVVGTKKSSISCENPQIVSFETLITFKPGTIQPNFPF